MSTIARDMTVSRASLWYGLFGGAFAWTVHLMFAYGIAEFGCVGGFGERAYLGISNVAWMELALTAATTILSASATLVAYRSYRRLRSWSETEDAAAAECQTAWAGFLTSGLFTLSILFESIPILYYLHHC